MKQFNVIWRTYGGHYGIEETFNTMEEADDYIEYLQEVNWDDTETSYEVEEVEA